MSFDSTANPLFPGEVFANTADFDANIRRLLPKYDQMLDAIARCLPFSCSHILELGCGTGELSLKILQRYPSVQIVAVDYSPRMLQFAKAKIALAGYASNWTGIEMDFGEWANHPNFTPIVDNFNACVSSLAIHHLKDEMKLKLFERIYQSLNPGGCFWNADPILPESETMQEIYQRVRAEWAAEQGTTLSEIRAKVGMSAPYGYSHSDQLATLPAHLEMLTKAGFTTLAVPWKYYGLAVFGGWVG